MKGVMDSLKHEIKSMDGKLINILIENVIKTNNKMSDKTKKPQNTSVDVILLIDEFKTRFEKLGEKAKEIAQKDGRTVVTYDDAEKALRQIRTENIKSQFKVVQDKEVK